MSIGAVDEVAAAVASEVGRTAHAAPAESVSSRAAIRRAGKSIAENRLNYTMTPHESLTQVRRMLLDLHKALIERERAAYEKGHGAVSPAQMLQLLIRDSAFLWLHPISELIVRVDELISNAKDRRRATPSRPAMTPDQVSAEAQILLMETRDLLTAGDAPGGFRQHYDAVLQSDPAIVLMHRAVMTALPPADYTTH
jgi:hypothetical protein